MLKIFSNSEIITSYLFKIVYILPDNSIQLEMVMMHFVRKELVASLGTVGDTPCWRHFNSVGTIPISEAVLAFTPVENTFYIPLILI